jgi:hypothetical protein
VGNVTIFEQGKIATSGRRELSELAKSLATSNRTIRRIQTGTNGTFKRIINGEQIGNAVRGELNVIIIGALKEVSRIYYADKYDPNKEATLPNCWSNRGDKPEPSAADKQATSCAVCPQNVAGSGQGNSRACRFQRRISVLVVGDPSGEVYQFNIPSKSLFGKGSGNTHPFESYKNFLAANHESIDGVVTKIAYNPEAESMELNFTPVRNISDEEYDLVIAAQQMPETMGYTMITAAQVDNATKLPTPKSADVAVTATPVTAKVSAFDEADDSSPVAEPTKRQVKKPAEAAPAKNLAAVVGQWGDDE